MPDIASWNPPAELLQLGDPDRAYWSRRLSPRFVWTSGALVVLALGLAGAVLYTAAFTAAIPTSYHYLIYVAIAGCLAFAGGVVVNLVWWGSRRPTFLYAFYPSGLVVLTAGRRWAFLSWRDIEAFDTKYEEPILTLDDKTQIVVVHDFPDTEDFYTDLARYIEAKRRIVDDIPITASLVKYDKSTRRQLLLGAALLGVALGAGLVYFDWLDLVVVPDRFVSHETLVSVTSVEQLPRAWLNVECPRAVPSSGRIMSQHNHVTYVEARVVLIPVRDRFLAAIVRNTFDGKGVLRGEFSVWNEDADKNSQRRVVLDQVGAEFPAYRDRLLPIQLDATQPTETYAQLLALSLAIGFVVGLGLLCRGIWAARHSRPRLVL